MSTRTQAPAKVRAATTPVPTVRRGRTTSARDLTQLGAMGKAFSILEIIAAGRQPMSMTEIVRTSGLTKPTAHRITTMLAEMGFIERDTLKRGFIEGPRLIKLSLATLSAAAPRTLRHTILRSISEQIGETCNFGILVGSEVLYLDRVEAKWPLGLRLEAGSRVPAHCTAIGKLLLSQMPARERQQTIAAMPLARYTGRTLTDPQRLTEALERIAVSRIGIDDQEFIDGVVCVAVPVSADNGQVVGCIAISAPEARVPLEQALKFIPSMRDAAARLGSTFKVDTSERSSR
ncbi:MAG: IclR family transcriptional regulator [Hyphomicrobiaceae bacterium]